MPFRLLLRKRGDKVICHHHTTLLWLSLNFMRAELEGSLGVEPMLSILSSSVPCKTQPSRRQGPTDLSRRPRRVPSKRPSAKNAWQLQTGSETVQQRMHGSYRPEVRLCSEMGPSAPRLFNQCLWIFFPSHFRQSRLPSTWATSASASQMLGLEVCLIMPFL